MNRLHIRVVTFICAVVCAAVAGASVYVLPNYVRAADRSGDSRLDVWRLFSYRGEQTEVDIDSNFDGRPDIQEYYQHGALVRREVDRNFDDQIDLVEEFDEATQQHVRSVVDVDYDGTADLLVLFRDGVPVYSKYSEAPNRVTAAGFSQRVPTRHRGLLALTDPFAAEASVRMAHRAVSVRDSAIVLTAGGLPPPPVVPIAPPIVTAVADSGIQQAALPHLVSASPRAPPLS